MLQFSSHCMELGSYPIVSYQMLQMDTYCIVPTNFSTIDNAMLKSFSRLYEIALLKDDWGGYNEQPIPNEVINNAVSIVNQIRTPPEIFPVADGSINFEFYPNEDNSKYLIFNIQKDAILVCFSEIEKDVIAKLTDIEALNKYIAELYGFNNQCI